MLEFSSFMDREAIGGQIERILGSASFAGKNQLQWLLRFLFENFDTQKALKPDRLIRELWPGDTSQGIDKRLNSAMNRLRKALELYYAEEGKADPIAISLPDRSAPGVGNIQERRWIVAEPLAAIKDDVAPAVLPFPAPIENFTAAVEGPATEPAPGDPAVFVAHYHASRGRWRLFATLAALAIVVCAIVVKFSQDGRPQSGRLDGTVLTILNHEGSELWRKNFPEGFAHDYYAAGLEPRIWFGDLNQDGRTEVLFFYQPAGGLELHSSVLICYSDQGREKWRWTPGRAIPELDGTPAYFTAIAFGVFKSVGPNHRRIVVSARHGLYYPDQIAEIDSDGRTVSEYWHSGHLDYLALADLEGEGREEIVASGISNGYRQATLIVLDPDRVFGASSEGARPEIQIHGMGVAQERLRLLFPRSDLNKALYVYNKGEDLIVGRGSVRVAVWECDLNAHCVVWYEFDKNLGLREANPDDQFRNAHKEFYRKSVDSHALDAREEREFQRIRCLVGCKTEFVENLIP